MGRSPYDFQTFRGFIQLVYSSLSPEAQATECRRRVLNIGELFKSHWPAPQKQSVAFADSMEKMNLGPMDFPISRWWGQGGGRNGNSRGRRGVCPSPPAQKLQERTWGLPRHLMTELHHVRPARQLLHLPQRKGERREGEASMRAAGMKGAWTAGCSNIRLRRTPRPSSHCPIAEGGAKFKVTIWWGPPTRASHSITFSSTTPNS